MNEINETVYNGSDNTIELQLTEDGVPMPDHSIITRCVADLSGNASAIDSAVTPQYFDMTNSDRIILKFGAAGLSKGKYWMTLTIYTSTQTNGVVWSPVVRLTVV